MRIAVISDTHDNKKNIIKFVDKIKSENIGMIIHCGDVISPFIHGELKKFNGEVHFAAGLQDTSAFVMTALIKKGLGNLVFHGLLGELEIDNKKIAFLHTPKLARYTAMSGEYDVVFYGHTHQSNVEKINNCLLVNPGEIMGLENEPTFAIYDTKTNEVEIRKLGE